MERRARVRRKEHVPIARKGSCPQAWRGIRFVRGDRTTQKQSPSPNHRKKRSNVLSATPGLRDQTYRDTKDSTEGRPKKEGIQAPHWA